MRHHLDRDRLPAVESSATGRNDSPRNLGEEADLLAVLLVVLEEELRGDVERLLTLSGGFVVILLDREVPERDGALGA